LHEYTCVYRNFVLVIDVYHTAYLGLDKLEHVSGPVLLNINKFCSSKTAEITTFLKHVTATKSNRITINENTCTGNYYCTI